MIAIEFNLTTKTARMPATTIVRGADVPVRIVFSAAPGEIGAGDLQLALGTDATAPEVLAFTDDFSEENETTWTALLDASDERLAEFLSGKGPTQVNVELTAVIDGERIVAPHLALTVQPAIIDGPETSEGGPTYYTQAQVDALLAGLGGGASAWEVIEFADSPFTAVVGGRYQVDTSGGAITVTLPVGMVAGDEITIEDATLTWDVNGVTINPAASGFGDTINGIGSSYYAGVVGGSIGIVAIDGTFGVSVK